MNRRDFLRTTSIGAAGLVVLPRWASAQQSASPTASPSAAQPAFTMLTLSGTPLERGRIHGESLRPNIRELCEGWKQALDAPPGTSADDYIRRFVSDTQFLESMRRFTPWLLEEVKGISDGSGLPFETVYAMQLVDEEWCYMANRRMREAASKDKCTAIGVSRSAKGPSFVAQNIDIPGYAQGHMTLLRLKPRDSDVEALVVSYAGLIALNGLNSKGVGVCVNAMLQLANRTDGLPVACVIRGLLERRSLDEAEQFLREIKHASGQTYNVGDPESAASWECSAGKAVPFLPSKDATRFAHTNHPLANDDLSLYGKASKEELSKAKAPGSTNSEARYRAAASRIADATKPIGVETIRAALGSHDSEENPVCCHFKSRDGSFSAACTIMELTAKPRLLLAPNPPCTSPLAEHRFDA